MNNDVMMDQHIPFYKLDKKVRSEKMMGRHNSETKTHSILRKMDRIFHVSSLDA